MNILDFVTEFLNNDGQVAIIDGKDFSPEIRALISQRLSLVDNCSLIWIESLMESESVFNELLQLKKIHYKDEYNKSELQAQVERSKSQYIPIDLAHNIVIRLTDTDHSLQNIQGELAEKIAAFTINLKIGAKKMYFSRHGESLYNLEDRIGGDPDLSPQGKQYPPLLNEFFQTHF